METKSGWKRDWIEGFMTELECSTCHGARLNDSVLSVRIGNKNIYELTLLSIRDMYEFFASNKYFFTIICNNCILDPKFIKCCKIL